MHGYATTHKKLSYIMRAEMPALCKTHETYICALIFVVLGSAETCYFRGRTYDHGEIESGKKEAILIIY